MPLQTRLASLITAIGADIKALNTGKLGVTAKAADSELLDGIDSTGFLRKGDSASPTGQNTTNISTPNQRLKSGFYEITGSALMPDTGWWYLQVYAHTNESNSYFRQVAYAFGDNRVYVRRISAAAATDVTVAGNWTAWFPLTEGTILDGGTP